jgi:hypothetical protein
MAGLDPAIHVFGSVNRNKDVDARHKAGHDGQGGGNQLRGAETGGGPKPTAFFGFSVPT